MKKGIIYFSLLMSIMLLSNVCYGLEAYVARQDNTRINNQQLLINIELNAPTPKIGKEAAQEVKNRDENAAGGVVQDKETDQKNLEEIKEKTEEFINKQPKPKAGSSNKTTSNLVLNGCGEGSGLFSGLVKTGSNIFLGLRDLIYVVAGFGIIGVAVGGFFGNLNWKWLGAIIIGLIVIASTGEIIATVTDCKQFTSTVIQDTLK